MKRAFISALIMLVTSFMGLMAETEEGSEENDKDQYYVRISMQGDPMFDNDNVSVYSHIWPNSPPPPDSVKMWINGEKVNLKIHQFNYWTAKYDLEYGKEYVIDICLDSLMVKDTKIRMVDRQTVNFQEDFTPNEHYVIYWDIDNDSDFQAVAVSWDYEQGKRPQHYTRYKSLNPGDRWYIVPAEDLELRDTTTYCEFSVVQTNEKRTGLVKFKMRSEDKIKYDVSAEKN